MVFLNNQTKDEGLISSTKELSVRGWILILCFLLLFPDYLFALQDCYKVGTEDILSITVWNEPELDKTVVVAQDGTINYPLVGNVPVAGCTVRQIDERITRLLAADYLVNPEVDVTIKEYHSQKVLVLGEILHPGLYVLSGPTSLLEIISKAGGVSDKVGSRVSILRSGPSGRGGKGEEKESVSLSIDLEELLKKGNLAGNIDLYPGDIVFLAGRKDSDISEQQVYISGRVQKPGAYEYQKGLTALNACIMAGGFEKDAASNRTILTRNIAGQQQIVKINLDLVKDGKRQDIQLQPGDRLFVPESFW
ncbi:MAG: polysaccharide biosynthesis/export family protein [bacterium]